MKTTLAVLVLMGFTSCAGTGVKKVVIDESNHEPSWVSNERLSWEDDGRLFFKAHQTVRGDQRLNGCYAIASHDNREALIRRQVESMSGQTNEAQADISENAEMILGKVRSGEWSGKLYGFRDDGYFFQRVQIRDEMAKTVTERIECYTLSSISNADYDKSRMEILNKIVHIDQRVKDAITQKETDFFKKEVAPVEQRAEQRVESEVKQEVIKEVPQAKPASAPVKLPDSAKTPDAPKVPEQTVDKAKPMESEIEPGPVQSETINPLASAVE